jgi:hypothetical protein
MPHLRARISGENLGDVDDLLREARVGVVTSRQIDSGGALASGVPSDSPEVDSVEVSVDAADAADAESRLSDVLPDGCTVEILDS